MGKKKARQFTNEEKLKFIKKVDANPNMTRVQIARMLDIPTTTLNTIVSNRKKIEDACLVGGSSQMKRLRKSQFPALEDVLVNWFKQARASNIPIDGTMIQAKASHLAAKMGFRNFKASNGWLAGFRKRNRLPYKSVRGEASDDMAASRAVKEQLSEHEEPGSWNTNEVFIKQEVDLSDGIIEDDNSIGNSSVGESEFSQIRQPDLNKQAGNRRGSTELSQERLPKKRKAALEHAYIRPHLPVTARQVQEEKSSVVESQPEQVWDPISTESAEQSKRKSQETPYGTQKESIAHQKEELEAVLLRLQVKKLLLEMEKISEERERIAVEKSNITLRYKCLELREKLNNSILSGTATERLGCASSFIPTIIVDSSSVARSKCSISAVSPGSKSSAAGKKCYASSPVKSRKSSSLSGKGNISTPATSNKSSESGICKISAKDVSSSKAMVQHTSDPETIQDTTPPKCISSVAGGHVMKGKVSGQDKLPLKQTQQKQTTSKAHIEISNTTHTKSKVQSVPSSINSSSEVCLASVPSDTLYPVSPSVESHSVSLPPQISETAKTTSSSSVNKLLVSPTQQPNQESCVKDEPVMTKLDNGEKITVSSSPSQTSHMVKGPTTCSGDGRNTSSAKKYLVPSSEQPDLKVSVKEPVDAKLDIAEEMSEPSHSQCVPVSTFKEDGELLSDDNDQLAKRRKLS
ncbi:uncharacterized protein [Anabrus simplex]|uniref:uncharacterized protein isoform X3 n=1 Tax=Anabrus simplex TaxID=316456 RepID=UPI0035A36846